MLVAPVSASSPPLPSPPLPHFLSPTLAPAPETHPPRLRALAQCRLERLHCLKEAERTACVSIITLSGMERGVVLEGITRDGSKLRRIKVE